MLDALEAAHPPLVGTTRDPLTKRRRAFVRFFACGKDLSDVSPDAPLPEPVPQVMRMAAKIMTSTAYWI